MGKRERDDEDEALEVVLELSASVDRALPHLKLRALDNVSAMLSPADELYNTHSALIEADAAHYLVLLLQDDSPAVALKAAEAVAQLASHSAAAKARLAAGPMVGLESSVERVQLNPVQGELVYQGAVGALAPLTLSSQEALASAAESALAALCSFNQAGKVAYLELLVTAAQAGRMQALAPLDTLLGGMECGGDDVSQLLETLYTPLMQALNSAVPTTRLDCLALLGTLCEKCPGMASTFRDAGAVALMADRIVQGTVQEQDAAVHCLWLLTKDDTSLLGGDSGALSCDLAQLASRLILLVKASEEEERESALLEDEAGGAGSEHNEYAGGRSTCEATPRLDICYAEEASKLLRGLAAQHADVARLLVQSDMAPGRKSGCCVM